MPPKPQTGTPRLTLRSMVIGLGATGIVVVLVLIGVMSRLEQIAFDWRSRWFSRFTPPPSTSVVHVHIDDNALSTVGRWPWPRAYLADVVSELDLAGASVIAFDLLFDEPQPPRIAMAGRDENGPVYATVEDDALLAQAIARSGQAVLAMDLAAVTKRSEIAQRAILRLKGNLSIDAARLATSLNATPAERRKVTGFFNELRASAARDRIRELFSGGSPSIEECYAALLPDPSHHRPDHPAALIIQREYDQVASLYRIIPLFPRTDRPNEPIRADLPIDALTRAARSAGVVSYEADSDGVVRSTPLWVVTDQRLFPHFALAAACELLDVPVNSLLISDTETVIPGAKLADGAVTDIRIPMLSARPGDGWTSYPRDRVYITWPTNASRWEMLYDPQKQTIVQQVPIGTIVELHRARRAEEHNYWGLLNDEMIGGLFSQKLFDDYRQVRQQLAEPGLDAKERGALLARRAELRKPIDTEVRTVLEEIGQLDETGLSDEERDLRNKLNAIVASQAVVERVEAQVRQAVSGKVCVIGWSATGSIADFIPTALYDKTPGPIGHGAMINAILTNHFLDRAPRWLDLFMVLLVGGVVTMIATRFPPVSALVISTGLGVFYFLVNGIAVFDYGNVVLAAASPCLAGVLAWMSVTVFRLVMEQREKARITKQFKNYVSGDLVDLLVANPTMIKQGRHELTCMFCDIAGFTTVTEALGPEQIIELLNRYLGVMTQRIMDGRGTVNKYMGDCIMAFWGAPIDDDEHTLHACRSVMDCFAALKELEKDPFFQNVPKLAIRFGVATGPMMVGDCGAPPDRSDYTVIGDVVNLSSRLEGANKAFGTKALVNARTAELVGDDMLLRPIGRVQVVGKVEPVEVFELMNTTEAATDAERRLAEMTTAMVEAFQASRFADCDRAADALREATGESKLADLYSSAAQSYLEIAPPDGFAGELVLSEK